MNRIKLAAAVLAAALALPALRAGDSPWGIAAHPHSEMEWKNIDRQLGMMREAGMTSLRHDMKFSGIARKKGEYPESVKQQAKLKVKQRQNLLGCSILHKNTALRMDSTR